MHVDFFSNTQKKLNWHTPMQNCDSIGTLHFSCMYSRLKTGLKVFFLRKMANFWQIVKKANVKNLANVKKIWQIYNKIWQNKISQMFRRDSWQHMVMSITKLDPVECWTIVFGHSVINKITNLTPDLGLLWFNANLWHEATSIELTFPHIW